MLTSNKNIMASKISTKQLTYWLGKFGDDYIERNSDLAMFRRREQFFKKLLQKYPEIKSVLEVGSNIGGNLMVFNKIDPKLKIVAVEPNKKAAKIARENLSSAKILEKSVFDMDFDDKFDLVFTCGVLIHIADNDLGKALTKIYNASRKYILTIEYYSNKRSAIPYRGLSDALFKRPYDKEYLNLYPKLKVMYKGSLDKSKGFDNCKFWVFKK